MLWLCWLGMMNEEHQFLLTTWKLETASPNVGNGSSSSASSLLPALSSPFLLTDRVPVLSWNHCHSGYIFTDKIWKLYCWIWSYTSSSLSLQPPSYHPWIFNISWESIVHCCDSLWSILTSVNFLPCNGTIYSTETQSCRHKPET